MSRKAKTQLPATPIEFPRADPAELAKFDPSTKACLMNCGGHRDDPRDDVERKLLCDDCYPVRPKQQAPAHGDIIRMCEEVGILFHSHTGIAGIERITTCGSQSIRKIEALVAMATEREREACANLAQQYAGQVGDVAWTIAGGIRARGRA